MEFSVMGWVLFHLLVLGILAIDLGLFHKKSHEVSTKESLIWCAVWAGVAGAFGTLIYSKMGSELAMQFAAGYIIELALSVDNLFVFIMLFSYFKIPAQYQHKVLFWGILGAIIMRAGFIFAGIALLSMFHWIIYIFGLFLIVTGIKMLSQGEGESDPEKNYVIRLLQRFIPLTKHFDGEKFFSFENGRKVATPLFVVLCAVEITDLVFALDSIPAVLAISKDPFIVYTSNIFAILGLRSLYFALAGLMGLFHYLKYALSMVLIFVGMKMMISEFYHVPIPLSLSIILGLIVTSIIASLMWPKQKTSVS
jgi:tellurite resistance protein TerC